MHKGIIGGKWIAKKAMRFESLHIIIIGKGEGRCRQLAGEQMIFRKDE